jgi:hypothetical protein
MTAATLFFGVLASFVAFLEEHRRCGELDGGTDDGRVWLACSCGAEIAHPVVPSPPVHGRP